MAAVNINSAIFYLLKYIALVLAIRENTIRQLCIFYVVNI